ncbi:MAG: hypothetical protein ACYDHE_20270 [Candidatus Acidiferrales bacterium]
MPSPDGSSIVDEASPDRMWVRGIFVTGRPTPPSNLSFPTWADDSSRLCAIAYNPDESSTLWVADPKGAWSKVAAVGRWVMNGGGPTVAACSWTAGRIAVAGFGGGNGEASEFWIFAWDGTVLMHRQTSPKAAHIYTFSRDASIWADFDESTGDTVVNDLTGNQLAVLKATFVEAFTWTGHYALAFDSTYNPGTRPNHGPYLLDWRSGRVVWHSSGNPLLDTGIYGPVALQPDGDGLALPLESIDCVGASRCKPVLQIVAPTGSWRLGGPAHLAWIALWPTEPGGSSNVCGSWSSGGASTGGQITRQYGQIRDCLLVENTWVITTLGLLGGRGVIALDTCSAKDSSCTDGSMDHPFGGWRVYAPPYPGGVTILRESSPGVLIVDNGGHQITFTIATATFSVEGA